MTLWTRWRWQGQPLGRAGPRIALSTTEDAICPVGCRQTLFLRHAPRCSPYKRLQNLCVHIILPGCTHAHCFLCEERTTACPPCRTLSSRTLAVCPRTRDSVRALRCGGHRRRYVSSHCILVLSRDLHIRLWEGPGGYVAAIKAGQLGLRVCALTIRVLLPTE